MVIKKLFFILMVIDIIALNAAIVWIYLHQPKPAPITHADSCPVACSSVINQIISTLPSSSCNCPAPSVAPTSTPSKNSVNKAVSKTRTLAYVPIPGSGQTQNNQWTDLPGTEFYLSTTDYPDMTESYLEANFRLQNGNGTAFIRLFDTTVGVEVWGSQIQTSSQTSAFVSSAKLTLRPGNHLYRLQAKSLTADTTILTSARLKIFSVN